MAKRLKNPVQTADLPQMPAQPASLEVRALRWGATLGTALFLLATFVSAPPAPAAIAAPGLDTVIVSGPAEGALIEEPRPSFSFEATLAGAPFSAATFLCSVDDAPAAPCTSPFQTNGLEEGAHGFAVFAEDAQQLLVDATPAERSFTVIEPDEECEVFEDEAGVEEEVGECEEEEANDSRVPPEECVLRTARARLFTYSSQNRVRLVIRYTAFDPGDVYLDYRLSGAKGGLKLGTAHQHFERRGLLRVNQRLGENAMSKVRTAKRFTVVMTIPAAPRFCRRYDTRHLTIRRTIKSQAVWFQSDSVFGS